jgi:hypothetical protein
MRPVRFRSRLSQTIALGLALLLSACGHDTPTSPTPAVPDYSGVWIGAFNITSCTDVEVPGLIQLGLCGGLHRTQGYRFTLVQNGTAVTGSYEIGEYFNCACGSLPGSYGTFDMSGVVASDGTLTITAQGTVRFTGGTTALEVFTLNQSSSSNLTGTVAGHLQFNAPNDRSVFAGVVTSGSR